MEKDVLTIGIRNILGIPILNDVVILNGNQSVVLLSSTEGRWLVDSGSIDHMTHYSNDFTNSTTLCKPTLLMLMGYHI
ncbi:hypothetical protein CR513_17880, partial [Mucuna pruriens]